MAKTKGPLLSLDAHGSLSKLLTYSNRHSGQQVRKYNKPLAIPSAKQRGQRRLTEFLVAQWQNMTPAEKATWEANAKASALNLPGYQYFLSEAQRDLYTHHGLMGYWSCNEIVNNQIADLSGNGHTGTVNPAGSPDAPFLVASKNTRLYRALDSHNINGYVEIPRTPKIDAFGKTQLSGLAWIRPRSNGVGGYNYGRVFDKMAQYLSASSTGGYRLRLRDEVGQAIGLGAYVVTEGTRAYAWTTSKPVKYNEWVFACFVYNEDADGALKIYANAVLQPLNPSSTASSTKNVSDDRNHNLFIARTNDPGSQWDTFDGLIDEVSIYKRALKIGEIVSRYNFGRL